MEVQHGWAGIRGALARSQAGDTVTIAPGLYEGSETLQVKSGVTLLGCAEAVLRYSGHHSAVSAISCQDATFADLVVELAPPMSVPAPAAPSPMRSSTSGYSFSVNFSQPSSGDSDLARARTADGLLMGKVTGGVIRNCRVTGRPGEGSCIFLIDCRDVLAQSNHTTGGDAGMFLLGCSGVIEDNVCTGSADCGIELHTSHDKDAPPTWATLRGNTCTGNRSSGIAVVSADGRAIMANTCEGNEGAGILFRRCSHSPDLAPRGRIEANICRKNANGGINLLACEDTMVLGNQVIANGIAGICLRNDAAIPEANAEAEIAENRCDENDYGIVLLSASARRIEANVCEANIYGGIVAQNNGETPKTPSHATITANIVRRTSQGPGIAIVSSICPSAADNDCEDNAGSGIIVERMGEDDSAAEAEVVGNRCLRNRQGGMLNLSSQATFAQNVCTGNTGPGIAFLRGDKTPGISAEGRIVSNTCHQNDGGIYLGSAFSEDIRGNTATQNEYGIALEPHENSPGDRSWAASIAQNECAHNKRAGILLLSSDSDGIEDNHCHSNGGYGIILETWAKSLDRPSRAPLVANRCSGNALSGIALLSSASEVISGNACEDNGSHGIALEPSPASPELVSSGAITDNQCNRNAGDGIFLASSDAEVIGRNSCTANKNNGILLQRSVGSPERAARARIDDNRCSENANCGIVLLSCQSEPITRNHCIANQAQGIALTSDDDTPDYPSSALIVDNACSRNARSGILLLSSDSDAINGNLCSANGLNGIDLGRADNNPRRPSRGCLEGNQCTENGHSGIALFSSTSGSIARNHCSGNAMQGIVLALGHMTLDQPSVARMVENECRENTCNGILVLSSLGTEIERNTCQNNGYSGIAMERSSEFLEMASTAPISGNDCSDNGKSGIVLFSSSSSAIAGNRCNGNALHGIALEPGSATPGEPSNAPITGNDCSRNGEAGILLLSSDSEPIEDNRCSLNGTQGITIQRANVSPDRSSHARIAKNRCDRNTESGILLFASESEEIAANDCWDNGLHGIQLLHGEGEGLTARAADIRGNRCHHNEESGIVLHSAQCETIRGNASWHNGYHGILLTRRTETLGLPSRAGIIGNSCYGNETSGITLYSSIATVLAGNQFAGTAAEVTQEILNGCTEESQILETAAGPDESAPVPALDDHLAAALAEGGVARDRVPLLYGLLTPGGCVDCLTDLLGKHARPAVKAAESGGLSDRHHHYALSWRNDTWNIAPIKTPPGDGLRAIGTELRQVKGALLGGLSAPIHWHAVVTADETVLDRMAEIAAAVDAGDMAPKRWWRPIGVHPLQVFDHAQRGSTIVPSTGLFEEGLARPSRWRDRLSCFARMPELWALVLLPLLAVWLLPAWSAGQGTAIRRWLAEGYSNWATITVALLLVAAGIVAWLNLRMPRILAIRHGPLVWLAMFANTASTVVPVKDLWAKLAEKFGSPIEAARRGIEDRAWLAWTKRRLYRRGRGAYPIAITDLETWGEEDLRRLQYLVDRTPHGVVPYFILQTSGRVCVHSAMLSLRGKAPWARRFDLLMLDDDDKLRLDIPAIVAACAAAEKPSLALLGGPDDAEDRAWKELRGSLVDDEWSPIDLLPSLSLGSAPVGKFSLRRTVMKGHKDELTRAMQTYASFFVDGAQPGKWSQGLVDEIFDMARTAKSLTFYETKAQRHEFDRITGRMSKRNDVALLMARLWGDRSDALEYIASALTCGIAQHQDVALMGLSQAVDAESVLVAQRAFECIGFLAADLRPIEEIGCPRYGEDIIQENWRELEAWFSADAASGEQQGDLTRLYCAFLGARCAVSDEAGARLAADELAEIERRIAEPNGIGLATPEALTRRTIAIAGIAGELRILAMMDAELARETLPRLRAQHWRLLPVVLLEGIERIASDVEQRRLTLVRLLREAASAAEVEQIVAIHRSLPERVLYALAQLSVAQDDEAAQLALAGAALEQAIIAIPAPPNPGRTKAVLFTDLAEIGEAGEAGQPGILAWLADNGAGPRLAQLLSPPAGEVASIPHVIDRELDRLLLIAEKIIALKSSQR